MSLPGLNGSVGAAERQETVVIPAGSEWRFEIGFAAVFTLKLLSGQAELFGTELALGQEYKFSGQNAAVFTWQGCTIEYIGSPAEYMSDRTPMHVYANLHFALENLREQVKKGGDPPSVLVLGAPNSGKSTLCKILLSYACKMGRYPMFVNLDPRNPVFSPHGNISAAPISHILDVEDGWGSSPTNGLSLHHPKQPLVFYYGFEDIAKNMRRFKHTVSRLALGVISRTEGDQHVRSSGIIIDSTNNLADPANGYACISSVIADFRVNVVAVVGNERLYSDLLRRYSDRNLAILKIPRSGGCVDTDAAYTRHVQHAAIQHYFYGKSLEPLSPFTITVKMSDVTVYQVVESVTYDENVLPAGGAADYIPDDSDASSSESIAKLEVSNILENCVLAIVNAELSDTLDVIAESEIIGFVHIVAVDETKHQLRVLLPMPGRLPAKPLLLGETRYYE